MPVPLKVALYSVQGPKLTVLCRRQVATEIFFFSRQMEKSGRQKVVRKIFAS